VRLAISGIFGATAWTNVVYLKFTDDGTQTAADLKSIVDAAVTAWTTRFAALLSSGLTMTDAKATWITGSGTALEYEASYTHPGTASGSVCPANVAAVVNWSINQYYRGGHPRSYIPGILLANTVNDNQLTTGFQTALATASVNWMNDVNALTATHVSAVALGTVSFQRAKNWRVPPVFYPFKSAGVRNYIGTQRRRIGGR
jgi:hypothetical protein